MNCYIYRKEDASILRNLERLNELGSEGWNLALNFHGDLIFVKTENNLALKQEKALIPQKNESLNDLSVDELRKLGLKKDGTPRKKCGRPEGWRKPKTKT